MPEGFPPTLDELKGWLHRQPKATIVGVGGSYHNDPLANYLKTLPNAFSVDVTDQVAYVFFSTGVEAETTLCPEVRQFVMATSLRLGEDITREEALRLVEHIEHHPPY